MGEIISRPLPERSLWVTEENLGHYANFSDPVAQLQPSCLFHECSLSVRNSPFCGAVYNKESICDDAVDNSRWRGDRLRSDHDVFYGWAEHCQSFYQFLISTGFTSCPEYDISRFLSSVNSNAVTVPLNRQWPHPSSSFSIHCAKYKYY